MKPPVLKIQPPVLKIQPPVLKIQPPLNLEGKFIIGDSPIELMNSAVELEYEKEIRPLVGNGDRSKCIVMERYVSLLTIYAMNKYGKGNLKLCVDACRSDLMFSTIENPGKFIGIQVKTTTGTRENKRGNGTITSGWSFAQTDKDYKGLLMYFRSITDGEAWLIPFNILVNYHDSQNITIVKNPNRKTRIDWSLYKVDNYNIAAKIYEYYLLAINGSHLLDIKFYEDINRPVHKLHQNEQQFRKKIICYLEQTNLPIKDAIIENSAHDFVLGDLKIQEKIASITNSGTSYSFELKRRSTDYFTYIKDDFDILIIHVPSPNDDFLYFIPMDILVRRGIIKSFRENKRPNAIYIYPQEFIDGQKYIIKDNWPSEFLLSYKDPNLISKILAIYNKQLYHKEEAFIIENPIFWNFECKSFNDLILKWNLPKEYSMPNSGYTFKIYDNKILEKTAFEGRKNQFQIDFKICREGIYFLPKKGDFDFIYVRLPRISKFFYLIPSTELESEINNAQERISLPYLKDKSSKTIWINKFIFYHDDPHFTYNLTKLFKKYNPKTNK